MLRIPVAAKSANEWLGLPMKHHSEVMSELTTKEGVSAVGRMRLNA